MTIQEIKVYDVVSFHYKGVTARIRGLVLAKNDQLKLFTLRLITGYTRRGVYIPEGERMVFDIDRVYNFTKLDD